MCCTRSSTRASGTNRVASSSWRDTAAAFARNRAAMAGLVVLSVFVLMALFAPLVQHHDPTAFHLRPPHAFEAPSRSFWLGTDEYGRDEYSRLVHGARISLTVAVVSQIIGVTIGLVVGMAAGLGGRRTDTLLMRLTDVAYAFPDLLLLILVVSVLRANGPPTAMILIIALGLVSWTTIARLVRGQVLSLREEPFIMAARAIGANDVQVAWRHLLPNIAGPVIVATTFGIPQAMFAEAALSFIGLGVPLPTPTWGNLVVDSKGALDVAPWLVVASCSAISLTMLSFMLVGDGLRDALDPRTVRRRHSAPDEAATSTPQPRELPRAA